MESQKETPIRNGADELHAQRASCSPFGESNREQEEGGETDEDMLLDGGMEDWNGFISGGTTLTEVVAEWRPGEPVTPQHVLSLNNYTGGKSALYKTNELCIRTCVSVLEYQLENTYTQVDRGNKLTAMSY